MEILRLGSRGPNVELLQTALRRAGYSSGPPDGIFGAGTRQLVISFQEANGLTADGEWVIIRQTKRP